MTEKALDKKTIVSELAKSPHGKLEEFLPVGQRAAAEDPDFFAHLVAWNHVKGEVRDAKVALPLISLKMLGTVGAEPITENALAHLADLNPRMLGKALLPSYETKIEVDPKKPKQKRVVRVLGADGKPIVRPSFAQQIGAPTRLLRRLVTRYLRDLEADRRDFERTAVQHARVLANLYAHYHVSRPQWVGEVLFHGEKGKDKIAPERGVFGAIRQLKNMSHEEAAGTIVKYKIPFIVARGALGARSKEPDQVLALIKAMSPTELVTNMRWLESAGVKTIPALRAALEEALGKAATSKRPGVSLKASVAAKALEDVEPEDAGKLKAKLDTLQEKQLEKMGGVDGSWLVLADKSGSMERAIELARQVTAILTRMVKGNVHLIFFDTSTRYIDATGKTLDELTALTRGISAVGGTSIGCGLQYALEKGLDVDGIAIVSDGGENTVPLFGTIYPKYCAKIGHEPTVYLYQTEGDPDFQFNAACAASQIDVQRFDLKYRKIDYASLPNLVKTMRVSRYSLVEEILDTPLSTLDEVLKRTVGMQVLATQAKVPA